MKIYINDEEFIFRPEDIFGNEEEIIEQVIAIKGGMA